ncbi:hypothetical protein SOVF_140120 [Spinacia oleracea]|uniref:Protein CURVATURE THYLAKOID 1D, chloroplastic n=1 Tax=Spinacia oleracea TaxID=3562 RepID=A0A9R0IUR6_SPIOL|nr:protein CURVATURE THYLAKOID 1D, chloroplastic [Spinacia oleracea]KNA10886.1 hypothetical protein SOVF_140120 [Spinacia oleracea]
MELCIARGALSIPPLPLSSSRPVFTNTPHFSYPLQKLSNISGVVCDKSRSRLLRASLDETSSKFTEEKSGVATFVGNDVTIDKAAHVNEEDSSSDDETLQPIQELFNKLDIQLDFEDSSTIFLYGGVAVVAAWLVSAVVGAIDSIPVFPKLMEVVGLGYSVWFTTRYLLYKKNREELGSKIEEVKQEIFGSSNK